VYIFYCAGGKFGEVAGVFLSPDGGVGSTSEKHSPDGGVGSTGRWSRASGVVSVCGSGVQSAPDAGTGRWAVTVCAFGVE